MCSYLDDPWMFLMVVHESIVCSEQLNWALLFRKILHVLKNLHIFCIFEPFPAVTVGFWDFKNQLTILSRLQYHYKSHVSIIWFIQVKASPVHDIGLFPLLYSSECTPRDVKNSRVLHILSHPINNLVESQQSAAVLLIGFLIYNVYAAKFPLS